MRNRGMVLWLLVFAGGCGVPDPGAAAVLAGKTERFDRSVPGAVAKFGAGCAATLVDASSLTLPESPPAGDGWAITAMHCSQTRNVGLKLTFENGAVGEVAGYYHQGNKAMMELGNSVQAKDYVSAAALDVALIRVKRTLGTLPKALSLAATRLSVGDTVYGYPLGKKISEHKVTQVETKTVTVRETKFSGTVYRVDVNPRAFGGDSGGPAVGRRGFIFKDSYVYGVVSNGDGADSWDGATTLNLRAVPAKEKLTWVSKK